MFGLGAKVNEKVRFGYGLDYLIDYEHGSSSTSRPLLLAPTTSGRDQDMIGSAEGTLGSKSDGSQPTRRAGRPNSLRWLVGTVRFRPL